MAITQTLETILVDQQYPVLTVTLNRPEVANAMNLRMVKELMLAMNLVVDENYRVLVIQGAQGNFCAGGDIKDMQSSGGDPEALAELNRAFGLMIEKANKLPAVVITSLQGAVLGGGLGLVCVSDVAIADSTAKFAMPETSLGIIPAQIAPFVVQSIGLTAVRRMALLGIQITAWQASQLGLIHQLVTDPRALKQHLVKLINQALTCAPQANQTTKALLHAVSEHPMDKLLDQAAVDFAAAVTGEGREGASAFMEKRAPKWKTSR